VSPPRRPSAGDAEPKPAGSRQLRAADGLAQLSFHVQALLADIAAEEGVSVVQMRLLGVLRDRTPTMKELAELLGLEKSSTTGLVDRAERRGLVVRTVSANDRRSLSVSLSDSGRTLAAAVTARFDDQISAMLDDLSTRDQKALGSLISRLLFARAERRGIELPP
jgi:DNA-binding MarR family transcriptional regulator